ncbi:anion-transporting ATPase-like domain-containing protein [Ochromonadaceae sp. CCMP2298]|nr:anion-transporting ATPase-like domain-containing protein [Ochromonadaceae sp. CCMP2298]
MRFAAPSLLLLLSATMLSVSRGFRLAATSRRPLPRNFNYATLDKSVSLPTRLFSSSLVQVVAPKSSDLKIATTQFVFVGGKGGVGKTTSSSAIALSCSDAGYRTLIVSTDPAHSLGDALDANLSSGQVTPISTESNLWALEIDVDSVLQEFKDTVKGFDSASIAASLGVPKDIVDSLGIEDIADIFTNPPPGIDEIVALTKIFQYAEDGTGPGGVKFDRIVIDTAPTGHTLRLLQLPDFLNTLTGKLIKFRSKINSAIDSFKGMFGGGDSGPSAGDKVKSLLGKLDNLQASVNMVKATLKDVERTQFVVVTIPTQLAVAESKRLVTSLQGEGIKVSTILCNQVLDASADQKYLGARSAGQRRSIDAMRGFVEREGAGAPAEVTEVPYVDTEVTGLYGLRFFHALAHPPLARSATNPMDSKKLTIFGGKGGVGKTTSSASWGVRLADSGFKTLVVSSDPAHSLGDALQEPLSGKPRLLDDTAEGGQLWAMEIDPEEALKEFQQLLKSQAEPVGGEKKKSGGMMGAMGLPNLSEELAEILYGIKDPPPGTDEIVALAKIISFLDNGYTTPDGRTVKFDRVVLDTAPTGHTLRMLQLPDFVQKLIRKVRVLREKTKNMGGMMGMGSRGADDGPDEAALQLVDFEDRMKRLEAVLHSHQECEFTAITIPTELATAETQRLLGALRKEKILNRRLIVNQVLPQQDDAAAEKYLDKVRAGQAAALTDLAALSTSSSAPLIKVPYYDMEVRTVYGLRVISNAIFRAQQ